jgi:hypothetical protein
VNYAEATNEELASQAHGGDESAVAELVERCWPVLWSDLLRRTAPEAARDLARGRGAGSAALQRKRRSLSVAVERRGRKTDSGSAHRPTAAPARAPAVSVPDNTRDSDGGDMGGAQLLV